MIKKAIISLIILNVFLLGVAVALWQLPTHTQSISTPKDTSSTVRPVTILRDTIIRESNQPIIAEQQYETQQNNTPQKSNKRNIFKTDITTMAKDNPFFAEASKVISGKLEEKDADNRRMILNYCEHLRTSYTTKDIDFLRQVFSDQALIIVGNVVRSADNNSATGIEGDEKVTFSLKTKKEYLERLEKVFAANKKIDVKFTDFRIMRHPTMEGIYGVSMKQKYTSDRYSDDGYLFILWDFRNKSMPLIHVRTWQPAASVNGEKEIIGIRDFNLE